MFLSMCFLKIKSVLSVDGLFISLRSLLGDRAENGWSGSGTLGGYVGGRIKESLVCQILRRDYKRTSRVLEEYTDDSSTIVSVNWHSRVVVRRTSFTEPLKSWINEDFSSDSGTKEHR